MGKKYLLGQRRRGRDFQSQRTLTFSIGMFVAVEIFLLFFCARPLPFSCRCCLEHYRASERDVVSKLS